MKTSKSAGAKEDLEDMIDDGSIHELDPEKDFTWEDADDMNFEDDDAGMVDCD